MNTSRIVLFNYNLKCSKTLWIRTKATFFLLAIVAVLFTFACKTSGESITSADGKQVLWIDRDEVLVMHLHDKTLHYFNNDTSELGFSYSVSGLSNIWHPVEPGLFASEDGSGLLGVALYSPDDLKKQDGGDPLTRSWNMYAKQLPLRRNSSLNMIYVVPFQSPRFRSIEWGAGFLAVVDGKSTPMSTNKVFVELEAGWVAQISVMGVFDEERVAREIVETLATTTHPDGYWPFIIEHYSTSFTKEDLSVLGTKVSEREPYVPTNPTEELDEAARAFVLGDYGKTLRMLHPLADQGIALAQTELGIMYENGYAVPVDRVEAVKWYRLATDQGFAAAQLNLGRMYKNGWGVPQDYDEAVRLFRLAADQDVMLAQNALGVMYAHGLGVPQNETEAARWYRLAADQGNPEAQLALGALFFNGLGVEQDRSEAAGWFRLAAEQGDGIAQEYLGVMFLEGLGVAQDHTEAVRWLRLSAEQGNANAQLSLGRLYFFGMGVPEDKPEAVKWYRHAAERGLSEAQYLLALAHHIGINAPPLCQEVTRWYHSAAKQGHAIALFSIGELFYYGECVQTKLEVAYALLSLSVPKLEGKLKNDASALIRNLSKDLTAQQIKTAEEIAAEWILLEAQQDGQRGAIIHF